MRPLVKAEGERGSGSKCRPREDPCGSKGSVAGGGPRACSGCWMMTGSGRWCLPCGLWATVHIQPCSSFGHKLMGQAAPSHLSNHYSKAGVWVPFQVGGKNWLGCRALLPWRQICEVRGGSPGKLALSEDWQDHPLILPHLSGQQWEEACLFGNSSRGTHLCEPTRRLLGSCRGSAMREILPPKMRNPKVWHPEKWHQNHGRGRKEGQRLLNQAPVGLGSYKKLVTVFCQQLLEENTFGQRT